MHKRTADHFASTWAIILAGGSGRRLEPLLAEFTGTFAPKQFCLFGKGERSLLQETLRRIAPSVPHDRTLVVTTKAQEALAARQLADTPDVLQVAQPRDRGTAAGILLPLLHIWWQDPGSTVVILPSDHAIARTDLFHDGIRKARIAVERAPSMIIVGGVEAEEPNGSYGWIVPQAAPDFTSGACLRRVEWFVEKPLSAEAESLFRIGGLWSTFILVAKANAILNLYRTKLPEAVEAIGNHDPRGASAASWERLTASYESLRHADFSSDLLATADRLAVLAWPAELGWTDLGTPGRLIRWLVERGELDQLVAMRRRLQAVESGAVGHSPSPIGHEPPWRAW